MSSVSRRDFIKGTAAVSAAALVGGFASNVAHAAGSDVIKIGVIGCGGRGRGAIGDCMKASDIAKIGVKFVAFGDLWEDRAKGAMEGAKKANADKVAADAPCFGGFDAYQKVIDAGVDQIFLATPPGFRPAHFAAAVKAGKQIFTEKPVCVDPVGYRVFSEAAAESVKNNLTVVAGTQRRHSTRYQATMAKLKDGTIGKLTGGQFYWLGSPVTHSRERKPGMSDIEWQCQNWYAWSWTCGDHVVEQCVHNIDIMCWAFGNPETITALGGRQVRPEQGNIFDHFAVEYTFKDGVRCTAACSHWPKSVQRVSERIVGEKGTSNCNGNIVSHTGEKIWSDDAKEENHYVQEHVDCLQSIKGGKHWNEAQQVADSCMAAVVGRMCAYTGREIKWDWATKASKLKLGPEKLEFGPYAPDPVALPGKTELI